MARVLYPGFIRSMFVFVDETGSDARNYMQKLGYSLRGMRTECPRFLARGRRISAIAAIDCDGLIDVGFTASTVDSDMFFDFIRGSLLRPFDGTNSRSVVIMDNCAIHHCENIGLKKLQRARQLVAEFEFRTHKPWLKACI